MKNNNPIINTDSYKFTHHAMYPGGTTHLYSYFESRVGAKYSHTLLFGLQYFIKEYLSTPITHQMIDEAKELCHDHLGSVEHFNEKMWRHIVDNLGGRLPVLIKAVPEGLPIPTGNILASIENTDPMCAPLVNHLETTFTHVWHASTVAALGFYAKSILRNFMLDTADANEHAILDYQLHDFGYRGVSSQESAALGGAAHLINFGGTDTVIGMKLLKEYYATSCKQLATSIPATEHSVMTALGESGEETMFNSLLDKYPTGPLSVVIDSYDPERFITVYARAIQERILNRNGKIVFRPDSLRHSTDTPEDQVLWILTALWEIFGGSVNSLGYRVLHPSVGVIWGDGIDLDGIVKILTTAKLNQFSASNMVFGMGGGLLQKINRDTQRFAFKASAIKFSDTPDVWNPLQKCPKDQTKASKPGKLALIKNSKRTYETIPQHALDTNSDILRTVFSNGSLLFEQPFSQIRKNAQPIL